MMSHNTISVFDGEEVQKLHQEALAVWMEEIATDAPDGWSKSSVNLANLIAIFPCLALKPGLALRAYEFHSGRDGNGIVWAMPADHAFPDPADLIDEDLLEEPPRPNDALTNTMEAIQGDGSPWSYLCASILCRELIEFGAMGHGSSWSTFHILGSDPLTTIYQSDDLWSEEQSLKSLTDWQWDELRPEEWHPTVAIKDGFGIVIFYTYSGLGSRRIIRHIDTYELGQYCYRNISKVIAHGEGGYVY